MWVRVANDHATRISFGIEQPLKQLKGGVVGLRAIKSRTRGGWGVSVEPAGDRIGPSRADRIGGGGMTDGPERCSDKTKTHASTHRCPFEERPNGTYRSLL